MTLVLAVCRGVHRQGHAQVLIGDVNWWRWCPLFVLSCVEELEEEGEETKGSGVIPSLAFVYSSLSSLFSLRVGRGWIGLAVRGLGLGLGSAMTK